MEDVMQETAVALWRKFEDYDPERPFIAWALRFSYYEVMKYHERKQRSKRLCPETLSALTAEFVDQEDHLVERRQALRFCLQKLSPANLDLLRQRYVFRAKIRDIAESKSKPAKQVYRLFDKIRRQLFNCVSQRLLGA
jgi:RNA polymerase sigma-70 factor (ECF subfamily)